MTLQGRSALESAGGSQVANPCGSFSSGPLEKKFRSNGATLLERKQLEEITCSGCLEFLLTLCDSMAQPLNGDLDLPESPETNTLKASLPYRGDSVNI